MASCSIEKKGKGRYLVRWREPVGREGRRTLWRARKRTVSSMQAATELRNRVLLELEVHGSYEEPVAEVPVQREVADAEQAAAAYLRELAANGAARRSIQRWGYALTRWFRTVRELHEISEDEGVPVTVFTRETFTRAKQNWRQEGLANQTVYMTARVAADLWAFAWDDREVWVGVPSLPGRRKGLLPKPTTYAAPPAPTLAEVDALVRWLSRDGRRNVSKRVVIVGRFTGLRASQILSLNRGDLDAERALLTVTVGKSRREQAERRTIPVSRHLVTELADVLDREPDQPLVRRASTTREPVRVHQTVATVKRGWEAVTEAGLARREVWAPPNRSQARPQHALRSAFQAALRNERAPEWVINRLVGHAGSTRDQHYVDDASVENVLREWVDRLPPIDWRER